MTGRTRGRKLKVKEGRDRRGVVDVFGHEVDLLGSVDGKAGGDEAPAEVKPQSPPPPPQQPAENSNADLAWIIDERTSEMEALKQEIGVLNEELSVLKGETNTLRGEAGMLRAELGTAKEELDQAQTKIVDSLAEVTILQADLAASRSLATALEAEVAATRGVAEALRVRLGEVEERLRVSEESRMKVVEQAKVDANEGLRGRVLKNLKMLALAWSISIPGLSSLIATTTATAPGPSPGTNNRTRRHRDLYDPRLSPLPRYVLLVGIGVCALVLRGIVRRVGGGVGVLGGRAVRGVNGVGVVRR